MVICESRCNGLHVKVTDHGAWINGKRVWPRKRRSWLAVLRRWRRMHPMAARVLQGATLRRN